MRIIGIDPGSRITGWGVIEVKGQRNIHVDNGCIFLDRGKLEFFERIHQIFLQLTEVIQTYHPREAAIEDVFVGRNAQSALKLGQARGAAIVTLKNFELPLSAYTPTQVKSAVVGYGRAEKGQMQRMVKALLNLPDIPYSDAADALSVAICHAASRQHQMRVQRATTSAKITH